MVVGPAEGEQVADAGGTALRAADHVGGVQPESPRAMGDRAPPAVRVEHDAPGHVRHGLVGVTVVGAAGHLNDLASQAAMVAAVSVMSASTHDASAQVGHSR